uniref:Pentatricopeptide repeat-containing protein n=1 Tax=Kalanchoe fedtschenkoi TaxID=63787 RepID=A0A7N0VN14_KALFE
MLRQSLKIRLLSAKTCQMFPHIRRHFAQKSSSPDSATLLPQQAVEDSVREAIQSKAYQDLPELVSSSRDSWKKKNPFEFLSTFPSDDRDKIIDEILQAFIPLRPRSRPGPAYTCLLSYTLHSSNPLPASLAILQRTLRSGLLPVPQTYVLLSSAWLRRRRDSQSASTLLKEMKAFKYQPDCGTCNYLISSLCTVDEVAEAVKVLNSMDKAGCAPDSESYGTVIDAMCSFGKTTDALQMMKEMVMNMKLTPKQGTMKKLAAALRANRESWRAVEFIEFLEREGCHAEFETYELVVEGCVESKEFVLGAKAVMKMTTKGFIPYIRIRQKLVEGLTSVGESELAFAVRRRFAELGS